MNMLSFLIDKPIFSHVTLILNNVIIILAQRDVGSLSTLQPAPFQSLGPGMMPSAATGVGLGVSNSTSENIYLLCIFHTLQNTS